MSAKTIPAPKLCRIEELIKGQWVRKGPDVGLLYPERVPPRYAAHGKVARVTELGDNLQPTGRVHQVEVKTCPVCSDKHAAPYDGSCLL